MDKKETILQAAVAEFAAKGYQLARVRDICAKAGCNLAAVNYYFGGKETLYREVVALAFAVPDPFDLVTPREGMEPKDYLLAWVESFLENTAEESPLHKYRYRIVIREMASPSPLFGEIMQTKLRPRIARLKEMARRNKAGASPEELDAICLLLIAQCIFLFNHAALQGFTGDPEFARHHLKMIARKIVGGVFDA